MRQNWPERLWLVRHGQSQGNVARDAAHEAGLQRHRPRRPRRRRAACRSSASAQAEAAGRWFAALPDRRAAGGHPVLALSPRAPDRRGDLRGRARSPAGQANRSSTSACASASSACSTGLTTRRHPREISRGSRASRQDSANSITGRPAARAGPTSSCGCGATLNTINLHYCRPARADRLPPGRGAVHALHPRGAGRGADPRHRQAGRDPQLRHLRLRLRARRRWAVRAQAGAVEPRRAARSEGAPQTAEPDAMTGSR